MHRLQVLPELHRPCEPSRLGNRVLNDGTRLHHNVHVFNYEHQAWILQHEELFEENS